MAANHRLPEIAKGKDKLTRLPKSVKVHKRPLLRPPIPSPYAGRNDEKCVYVGSKTPFMSAVKRVKSLLEHVDKRAMQSTLAQQRKKSNARSDLEKEECPECVYIKSTGKAIDKALSIMLHLQGQNEYNVRIKTSTVDAIDDLIQGSEHVEKAGDEELPESRIRHASMIEAAISLK